VLPEAHGGIAVFTALRNGCAFALAPWTAPSSPSAARRGLRALALSPAPAAFDDGRKIFRFPCMTGATDHPTDPGVFKIFNKDERHRSHAYNADMHYAMFFTKDGKAIHQYHGPFALTRFMKSMSDRFGSHGCVRLEEADARTLFRWTPSGTVVQVY
jgi:lipoprotein-anchoring transpeptidase ErfK/SrfK